MPDAGCKPGVKVTVLIEAGGSVRAFMVIWEVDCLFSCFWSFVTEPLWQEFHALTC